MSNFHASSQNLRLEGSTLKAGLQNVNGEFVDAELDLNTIIANNGGQFSWGNGGFAGSAQNLSVQQEGADNVPILRAELKDNDGNWQQRDINLAERIGNNNGSFQYE